MSEHWESGEGWDAWRQPGFPLGAINPPTVKRNRAKTQICSVYSGKTPCCKLWELILNK